LARANGAITRAADQVDSRPSRSQRRLRQRCQKLQAPVDPAAISRAAAGSFTLGHSQSLRQFAQQQRLFNGSKRPALRARQDTKNGFRQVTRPPLNQRSVPPKPAQRGHPAVAVDQHQTFAVPDLGSVRGGRRHNQGHDLTVAFDGADQLLNGLRFNQPCAGKAQLQQVQVDI
jgi:hypothetical protein